MHVHGCLHGLDTDAADCGSGPSHIRNAEAVGSKDAFAIGDGDAASIGLVGVTLEPAPVV